MRQNVKPVWAVHVAVHHGRHFTLSRGHVNNFLCVATKTAERLDGRRPEWGALPLSGSGFAWLSAALSALGQGPQGQADSFRNPGFLGHRLQGGEAFLFVVPEGQKGMEDVAARVVRSRRSLLGGDPGMAAREGFAELVLEFQQQALGRLLADAGNLHQPAALLEQHRLGEVGDREAGEHRQGGACADARDLDELTEGAPLVLGGEAIEEVTVFPHRQMGMEAHRLPETGQVVKGAHGHVELVAHAMHVYKNLGRVLFQQGAAQASDHGRLVRKGVQRRAKRAATWVRLSKQGTPAASTSAAGGRMSGTMATRAPAARPPRTPVLESSKTRQWAGSVASSRAAAR